MACFLVPAAEAVVAAAVTAAVKTKEARLPESAPREPGPLEAEARVPFSKKLKWLTNMLWGGSALLAFEHVWHGEVVPWFPFLTAAGSSAEASVMLREMATVGVSMAALVTVVWGVMLLVSGKRAGAKRPAPDCGGLS